MYFVHILTTIRRFSELKSLREASHGQHSFEHQQYLSRPLPPPWFVCPVSPVGGGRVQVASDAKMARPCRQVTEDCMNPRATKGESSEGPPQATRNKSAILYLRCQPGHQEGAQPSARRPSQNGSKKTVRSMPTQRKKKDVADWKQQSHENPHAAPRKTKPASHQKEKG